MTHDKDELRAIAEELIEAYKHVDFVRYLPTWRHPSIGEVVERARALLNKPKTVVGNGMHPSRQGPLA